MIDKVQKLSNSDYYTPLSEQVFKESKLSLDQLARNLYTHVCPRLAAELLLQQPMHAGLTPQC
jgi:hypothetical protein